MAGLIAATSLLLGRQSAPPAARWDHIVWGYIKMGKLGEARSVAERIAVEQPENGPILEALGYLAAVDGRYGEAVRDYQRAIALRPRSASAHYNLAKAFLALGDRDSAAHEANASMTLSPSPDTEALLIRIRTGP